MVGWSVLNNTAATSPQTNSGDFTMGPLTLVPPSAPLSKLYLDQSRASFEAYKTAVAQINRGRAAPSVPPALEVAAPPANGAGDGPRRRSHNGMKKLSYEQYDKHPGVRRSALDWIMVSPRHFQHNLSAEDKDSSAKLLGRAVHTLILEPHEQESRIVVYPGDRRGNAWKEFKAAHAGKDILRDVEFDTARRMRDAFFDNNLTRTLLNKMTVEGTAIWTDPETGVVCKARPDAMSDLFVYDLKTADDASESAFHKAAFGFGYHRQAAWYLDGVAAATGNATAEFGIIVIEKDAPHCIRVFHPDAGMIARGRAENRANLDLYARCVATGKWPGYPELVAPLSLPGWVQ